MSSIVTEISVAVTTPPPRDDKPPTLAAAVVAGESIHRRAL